MSEHRWLFFDLGCTLIDETAAQRERFGRLRRLGPPYAGLRDADYFERCEFHATHFASSPFLAMLQELDPTGWDAAKSEATYDPRAERLYPGVPGMLVALRDAYHLGIVANQSAGTPDRLAAFGILDAFSVVVSSAEAGIEKPDPRIFTRALALAGCSPHHATMVGDRLDNDIGPAKAEGWRTVRVLQGFARGQVPRSGTERPDATIGSIADLPRELFGS